MNNATSMKKEREFAFTLNDFRFISRLAYEKTGIVLPEQKKDMVYGRLVRRLRALNLNGFEEYCDLLKSEEAEDEMGHLINSITTNLTSFFREEHHFEHLQENILKDVTGKKLRLWSSACSSGMEAYSMAMTMKAALANQTGYDVKILATDIDSNMVATAAKGHYTAKDFETVPAASKQYIKNSAASDELKALISFKQLNLLEQWPMKGPFDAIFCRNVMIYFDKPTKEKLIDRMANLLKPGGWLYIGHSENLHGISTRFELVGRTIYRKVK